MDRVAAEWLRQGEIRATNWPSERLAASLSGQFVFAKQVSSGCCERPVEVELVVGVVRAPNERLFRSQCNWPARVGAFPAPSTCCFLTWQLGWLRALEGAARGQL